MFENKIIITTITWAVLAHLRGYPNITAYISDWSCTCSVPLAWGPDSFLYLLGIYIYSLAIYFWKGSHLLPEVKWLAPRSCFLCLQRWQPVPLLQLHCHLKMDIRGKMSASRNGFQWNEGAKLLASSDPKPLLDLEEFFISLCQKRHIPYYQGLSGTQTVTSKWI